MLKNASRDAFLYDFRKRVFFSFLPTQWLEILSCVPHGWRGRKKGMKRYRRQIIISEIGNVIWANKWLINQNIMSRSDFQWDRFREGFSIHPCACLHIETSRIIDSIKYLWDSTGFYSNMINWSICSVGWETISHANYWLARSNVSLPQHAKITPNFLANYECPLGIH